MYMIEIILPYILAAFFLVLFVTAAIAWYYLRKEYAKMLAQKLKEIDELRTKYSTLQSDLTQSLTLRNQLSNEIGYLKLQLQSFEHQDEKELTRIGALIESGQQNLQRLNESIEAASSRLNELESSYQTRYEEVATALQISNDARATLLEEQNQLKEAILASKQELEDLVKEKDSLTSVLLELNERHRVALLSNWQNTSELGLKFELNQKETQLVAAIKDICELYPDLSRELKKIEWEKVWRPKIQVYRTEYAGKQGIYKLTLASDTDVCYIGQARDVYTRWFEHMKKMIGVEAKGNEKLYEYGVADFYWKLLEEINDADKLNDAEHYWIEYWGCLEKGLNKKR